MSDSPWTCPDCGRVWVLTNGWRPEEAEDQEYEAYRERQLEADDWADIEEEKAQRALDSMRGK